MHGPPLFESDNNSLFLFFSSPPVPSPASATEPDFKSKDWVFLNYTYKRFEGLTQRGTIPTYMKAGKAWRGTRPCCSGEPNSDIYGHRVRAPRTRWRGPLVLKETPPASQYKFNPHHKLFRSAQPPREPPQARKKRRSVAALPRVVYIVSTCCL